MCQIGTGRRAGVAARPVCHWLKGRAYIEHCGYCFENYHLPNEKMRSLCIFSQMQQHTFVVCAISLNNAVSKIEII